ncbi:hypothetical protein ACQPXB_49400 [Amycolatopsis sp. CA-161197]|uniref:hypothetical protein n=1 Tax=Amycolatopsis sp. CA-161197 TaxID=3239922 RepID=UPI003D9176E0
MGNDANTAGKALKYGATGALAGAAVAGPVGAVVGGAVGGLVGIFSGGPEAQQQSADLGGRTIDARTIWDKIHVGDTKSLQGGVSAAQSLKDIHNNRITEIDNLNSKMDAAWQGGGATAAQAGAHPLGVWLQDSVNNLGKSHTYLNTQIECFDTVKGKVQEIPKDPPSAGFLDGLNPLSDKDDEINKYNDNAKANVDAYTKYYAASGTNAQGLPQYSAWQGNNLSDPTGGGKLPGTGGGGGKIPSMSGGPGGGSSSFKPGDMPKFDAKPPSTDLTGNHTGLNDPNGTGIPTGTYNPTGSDSTTAQGFTPSSFDSSGFGPGGGAGFGPGGSSGFGPGGGAGGAAGSGSAFGAGAGFGPGAFGSGAGFGPGGAASGAAEGLGGAAGARGNAMGGAMSGAAGKAGASGMGGMGAGGAKGGKGTEDEEHQTKYLVEEDANELFGTDELTAPPVIGE